MRFFKLCLALLLFAMCALGDNDNDMDALSLQGTWVNPSQPGAIALIKASKNGNGFLVTPNSRYTNEWVSGAGACNGDSNGTIHFVQVSGSIESLTYTIAKTSIGNVMKLSNGASWTRVAAYTSLNGGADMIESSIQSMIQWWPEQESILLGNMSTIIAMVQNNGSLMDLNEYTMVPQPKLQGAQTLVTACDKAIAYALGDMISFGMGLAGLKGVPASIAGGVYIRTLNSATARGFEKLFLELKNGRNAISKAWAVFKILGSIFKVSGLGPIFKAVRSAFRHMNWLQWTKTVAAVGVQFAAWFATDGVAFVAEIVGTILSEVTLIQGVEKAVSTCGW